MLAASAALAMRPWAVDSEADLAVAAADSGARSEAEAVATSAERVRLGAVEAGLASLAVEVACPAHAAAQASRWAQHQY